MSLVTKTRGKHGPTAFPGRRLLPGVSLGPLCPQSSCRMRVLPAQGWPILQASQIRPLGAKVRTSPCRGLSRQFPEGLVFPYSFHQDVPCWLRDSTDCPQTWAGELQSPRPPAGSAWAPCHLRRAPGASGLREDPDSAASHAPGILFATRLTSCAESHGKHQTVSCPELFLRRQALCPIPRRSQEERGLCPRGQAAPITQGLPLWQLPSQASNPPSATPCRPSWGPKMPQWVGAAGRG